MAEAFGAAGAMVWVGYRAREREALAAVAGIRAAGGRANAIQIDVRNDGGGLLYHLFFASKSPLGNDIWKSVTKTNASGQREMWE